MELSQNPQGISPEDLQPATLALIPSVDLVPLPGLLLPAFIEKGSALKAVEYALSEDGRIFMTLQSGEGDEAPSEHNLCRVGAIAQIVHSIKLPTGDYRVRFHITQRATVESFEESEPFMLACVRPVPNESHLELTAEDLEKATAVREAFAVYAQYDPNIEEHIQAIQDIYDPGLLADHVCSILQLAAIEVQLVLEEFDPRKRLDLVAERLSREVEISVIKERVAARVHDEMERTQREEILREQLRQIQAELGETDDQESDYDELAERITKARMPAVVNKEAQKQLRKLRGMHADASEAALTRTYLDWLLELPWSKRTKDKLDLAAAKAILDEDHFGLQETKERILDFLGVRKLKKDLRGPILLLVGPPGVGKTSLGRSIARALGRKFFRISLGGMRDEAELRGHRRTYVGALPGRVIQGVRSAGSKNPVFMLDELDKVGSDFRGDPSSVLLEVLDPEQNVEFSDHYLNVPFDLSEVMFICTANVTDTIPAALHDRLEIINLSGYTDEEKLQISKRHLIDRAKLENGLKGRKVLFPDKVVLQLIRGYTRESGVRELGRVINTVCRKTARLVAEERDAPKEITSKFVEQALGPAKFHTDQRMPQDEVGVACGLAWTSVGGELLLLETSLTKGKGSLSLTGQLGEVMRESAMTVLTHVQANAERLGIEPGFMENANLHIHAPHGAIPKDGPSAGTALATALVSLLTQKAVSRNVAMTGEITLRGKVLGIGGLKEKALAALRANIPVVVFPRENEGELKKFPRYLTDKVTFMAVDTIDDVLKIALVDSKNTKVKKAKKVTKSTK
jgi:ATP-dependent Lon protease